MSTNTFREIMSEALRPTAKSISTSAVEYDQKDIDRAKGITDAKKAKLMADKITDATKMVKRAKAVLAMHPDSPDIIQPFLDGLERLGFSEDKINAAKSNVRPSISISVSQLPLPVKRSGQEFKSHSNSWKAIMNASTVYSGKLSKVIPEASKYGKTVILLGIANPDRMPGQEDNKAKGTPIAIIGSASSMSVDENGLDYYEIPKSGFLNYKLDTGMGYRMGSSEIYLTSYVLCENGVALTKYKDSSYRYYVFK